MVSPRGRSAEIDEMLTIAPPLAVLIIAGIACFDKQEHGLDVDLHHAAILVRLLVDDAAAAADADIVVEEVEPAEAVDGSIDQPLAFGLTGGVEGFGRGGAALGLDHLDRAFGELQVAVGHQHLGAGARQQDRRRPAVADAVARCPAAAQDRDLAG